MPVTNDELDAYEAARAAERAVAAGTGDEDVADLWNGYATETQD
jgi:hypothetical protein